MKMRLQIAVFVMIDQMIKLYISNYMMDKRYHLMGNVVGFKPYLNIQYSWINSQMNLGVSRLIHIIIAFFTLFVTCLIYDFIRTKYSVNTYGYWIFAFLFAGSVCSLIDKLVWGGSLDYILLQGFFIFDLKDVYLSMFEVILILYALINKDFRNAKSRVVRKDFKDYLTTKVYKLHKKQ